MTVAMDGSRKLPELAVSGLIAFEPPELPAFQLPERPVFQLPELPQFQLPELPQFQLPKPPEFQLPELDLSGLIAFEPPELPAFRLPERPVFQLPEHDLTVTAFSLLSGLNLRAQFGSPLPEPPRPSIDSRRSESLELELAAIEPAFADQFRGARLRSKERGPDWLTQAATSYRKLFLGLLHTAAPDELVLPWVHSPRDQLDCRGHPTRPTKIDWLCRSIRDKRYRRFVRIELSFALEVLDLLNQAVHATEFPELEESFTSVDARMEFAIRHIAKSFRRGPT